MGLSNQPIKYPTSLSSIKSNELHSGSAKANDEELQACINVSLAEKNGFAFDRWTMSTYIYNC